MKRVTLGYAGLFLMIMFMASRFGVISPSQPELAQTTASAQITPEQIFSDSKDAVVRIGMEIKGNVAIPGFTIDPDSFELVPDGTFTDAPITTGFTGTGFVVNSDGYIVTNAHVVDSKSETTEYAIWEEFAVQLAEELDDALPKSIGQTEFEEINRQMLQFISDKGAIKDVESKIAVFNSEQKSGNSFSDYVNRGFPAEVVKAGQPYPEPGQDLTILKINKTGLTPLRLSSAKEPEPGTKILALGYPGAADLSEESFTQPSLTNGIVSSIKTATTGPYNMIQIDAPIHSGNSGGPVFNAKGDVIGVATLGSYEAQGFNFILPIELVRASLSENSIAFEGSKTGIAALLDTTAPLTLIIAATGATIIVLLVIILLVVLKRRKNVPAQAAAAPVNAATPPQNTPVAAPAMAPSLPTAQPDPQPVMPVSVPPQVAPATPIVASPMMQAPATSTAQ